MALTTNEIIELYTATFNRAADAAGVAYWETQTHLNQTEMANAFVISAEAAALYPSTQTNTEYVTAIYNNLFNHAPDAAGLAYWLADLAAGVPRENMIVSVVNGALGADQTILDNKTAVSTTYVNAGLNATDFLLDTVTADAATVTAANASIDTIVASTVVASHTLTTATDVVETTGADTFTATSATLGAADIIVDNSSTDTDVMNVTLTAAMAGATTITNVEAVNVNMNYFVGGTADVVATSISGATINLSSAKLGFNGQAQVTDATTNTVVAGSGITNLSVTGLTTGSVDAGAATVVAVTGTAAKANTITVNNTASVTNTTSTLTTLDITAASTVTYDTTAATNATTLIGAANVALKMNGADVIAGTSIVNNKTAGTTSLQVTAGAAFDATNFAVDKIIVGDIATVAATVATNAVLETNAAMTSLTVATTATTATTARVNTGFNIATLDVKDDGLVSTLNATANITIATLTATGETVNLTGSKNIIISTSDASTINASNMTGDLTISATTTALEVIAGSGANNVTTAAALTLGYTGGNGVDTIIATATTTGTVAAALGAGNDIVKLDAPTGILALDGGTGTDSIVLSDGADLSGVTGSEWSVVNFENISFADASTGAAVAQTATMLATQLTGATYNISVTGATAAETTGNFVDTVALAVTGAADLSHVTVGTGVTVTMTDAAATASVLKGTNGNDTIDGGTIATAGDMVTGGAGDDTFVLASTAAVLSKISDYQANAAASDNDTITTTSGTVSALVVAADVTAVVTGDTGSLTAQISATGIMTLNGLAADKAAVDTLAEWIAIADALINGDTTTVAFEWNGNTYVYEDNTGEEMTVELTGLTGITGVSATTAAAHTILIA